MTYAADIVALTTHRVAFSLVIDGIPFMFGSRPGLVYAGNMINKPVSWTSVAAIPRNSVKVDGLELNHDMGMVPPSSASLAIRIAGPADPLDPNNRSNWNHFLQRREAPVAYLTADVTETDGTIAINYTSEVSATFSVGDVVYINHEALLITEDFGTGSYSVTRNYCALGITSRGGSFHRIGSTVSKCPTYLEGRMAELSVWLNENQCKVLRNLKLATAPANDRDAGLWKLSFKDVMSFYDRKVCVGLSGSEGYLASTTYNNNPAFAWHPTPDDSHREFARQGNRNGSLLLFDADGGYAEAPILGWSGDNPIVGAPLNATQVGRVVSARRVFVYTSPMLLALEVLLSDRGLGANPGTNHATYDVLPGVTSSSASATGRLTAGEIEMRFGAAVPASMIDVDTLLGLSGKMPFSTFYRSVPGFCWILGARGEENLLDILEAVAYACHGFWNTDASGRLTFSQYSSSALVTANATVNASHRLRSSPKVSIDDESKVVHTIQVACNWDPVEGRYLGMANTIYEETKETYREIEGHIKIERQGLYVDLPGQRIDRILAGLHAINPVSVDVLTADMDRIYYHRARGLRSYTLHLPWSFSDLIPGQHLLLTTDRLIDFAGSTPSAMMVEITKVSLDPRAKTRNPVTVEVHDTWLGKLISPTARIVSVVGSTITLDATARWNATSGNPARYFAAGWKCLIRSRAASPMFSTSTAVVIAGITSDTVLTTVVAPGVGAAGDILTMDTYDTANSTTANQAENLAQHNHAFMANAGFMLGASSGPDTWG